MSEAQNAVNKKIGLKFSTWRDEDYQPHPYELSDKKVRELLDSKTLPSEKMPQYEAAYAANPKDFARLYSMIDNTKSSKDLGDVDFIVKSETGEQRVWAIVKKMQPTGLTMAISNGTIRVMPEGEALSPDKIKELAHFCWMNGISAEFPADVDKAFQEAYEKAAAELEEPTTGPVRNNNTQDETADRVDEELQAESEALRRINASAAQLPESERAAFIEAELKKREEAKKVDYAKKTGANPDIKKLTNHFDKFMARIGKEDGKTYFRSTSWSGEIVYRLYANPGDVKEDGKTNKGKKSNTYEIEFRFKIDKRGDIQFSYGTPNNKPIAQPYNDEFVGSLKAQGFTHINFPAPITDADKGAWREACARQGVIPEGFDLNEHQVKKMMGIAAESLSKADFLKYKKKMAARLRRQIEANNIEMDAENNRLRETIESLEAEYAFTPFKNAFEATDGIQTDIDKIVRGDEDGKADVVKVVGAALGFAELYEAYKEHRDKPLSVVLDDEKYFNPEEKAKFMAVAGIGPNDLNVLFRDIGNGNMKKMYEVLRVEWEEKSKKRIEERVNETDRNETVGQIIKNEVGAAYSRMKDVAMDLEVQGAGKIYPRSLGNPVYTGPIKINMNTANRQRYQRA